MSGSKSLFSISCVLFILLGWMLSCGNEIAEKKIIGNLPSVEIIALLIAALAVFFGPLIQLSIAKRQIRASVLSVNRQRWIDELREQIASFITVIAELNTDARNDAAAKLQKMREMYLCQSRIKLMVNPKEEDHSKLLELINNARDGINKAFDENKTDIPAIVALSQIILKREWERVKATE